jgi:hypothetical protein
MWTGWYHRSQSFGESCCLQLQSWSCASPKFWLVPTDPHGDLTQNNIIRMVTAMKILSLTRFTVFRKVWKQSCILAQCLWFIRPCCHLDIFYPFVCSILRFFKIGIFNINVFLVTFNISHYSFRKPFLSLEMCSKLQLISQKYKPLSKPNHNCCECY